jgi:farnesyl diphosphate synthase
MPPPPISVPEVPPSSRAPSFPEALTVAARSVEARLERVLAEGPGRLSDGVHPAPERLVAAMRHALLAGGKRFRPFLVLESARLLGVAPEPALETAAALECVHAYSLVHDDLPAMDDDDLRRGQPTVHRAFDEWTAILAGDALLTLAFELLASPAAHPRAEVRAKLTLELARASGWQGMAGGQALDLAAAKLGTPATPTRADVERLQAMKTGALIRFACRAGAILGEAPPALHDALERYGRALGWAFQISDDLLDVTGDAAAVGKAVGKDAEAGKATLVGVLGIAAARDLLARTEAEAIEALAPFGAEAEVLRDAARFVSSRDR